MKSAIKSFNQIMKGEPSVGDVHVATALGNQSPRRRRHRPFSAFVSGGPRRPQDGPSTFGPMPVITATTKRRPLSFRQIAKRAPMTAMSPQVGDLVSVESDLGTASNAPWTSKVISADGWDVKVEYDDGEVVYHLDPANLIKSKPGKFWFSKAMVQKQLGGPTAPPFPTDTGFMSRLHGPQVPSFLWALTHRDDLPKAKVPMDSLVAIQDRIDPKDVARDEEEPPTQRPTIVRHNGIHYIADGHDRLSARLLGGKKNAKVRLHDLDHPSNPAAVKKAAWSTPFIVEKADPDKQQLFGWASVVTKNGRPVIDKQDDIIPVDELEKAAIDFVLTSREQGDMHTRTKGVGRLIESMVFSAEKQKALGIDLGMEGWWVGFQCDCKDLWKDIRSGKKREFSIGGAAISEKVDS